MSVILEYKPGSLWRLLRMMHQSCIGHLPSNVPGIISIISQEKYLSLVDMSHFSYACKMQCPLNLVLENCEYL